MAGSALGQKLFTGMFRAVNDYGEQANDYGEQAGGMSPTDFPQPVPDFVLWRSARVEGGSSSTEDSGCFAARHDTEVWQH